MVGVAQLSPRELAHPRLLVAQQLEVTGTLLGFELGLTGRVWRRLISVRRASRPVATEDPAQEPHRLSLAEDALVELEGQHEDVHP